MQTFRALAIVVAAAALLGVSAPPAAAGDGAVVVFQGVANFAGGLGYPCTRPGTPPNTIAITATECPTPTANVACITTGLKKCKPLEVTNNSGDMLHGIIGSSACLGLEGNVSVKYPEKGKAPAATGACSITASLTILGYCGISTGEGAGKLVATDAVTGISNVILFEFRLSTIETYLLLNVQWWKAASWSQKPTNPNKGLALLKISPLNPQSLPLVGNQNCLDHSQRDFTMSGAGVFVPVKNL
jgi:hypothetical protein